MYCMVCITYITQTRRTGLFIYYEVLPEIIEAIIQQQCGATTDMWDDKHTKTDYTSVTVHYINKKWELIKRLMFTAAFNSYKKTGDTTFFKKVYFDFFQLLVFLNLLTLKEFNLGKI